MLASPPPEVNLLDTSSAVIAGRTYCHTDHGWQIDFDTNEMKVVVAREAGWPAPTPTQVMKTLPA